MPPSIISGIIWKRGVDVLCLLSEVLFLFHELEKVYVSYDVSFLYERVCCVVGYQLDGVGESHILRMIDVSFLRSP